MEGTPQVKRTTGRSVEKAARRARRKTTLGNQACRSCRSWSTGLTVSADGTAVVAHAGNVATRLLADQVGLTGDLSAALARRGFTPTHDRGRVLVDVAVLITGGGEAIADIDVLRHQSEVRGSVASAPTVWRARHQLDEVTPAVSKRIDKARAAVRAHVWSQLPDGLPASRVADTDLGDVVVLDVDATLVTRLAQESGRELVEKFVDALDLRGRGARSHVGQGHVDGSGPTGVEYVADGRVHADEDPPPIAGVGCGHQDAFVPHRRDGLGDSALCEPVWAILGIPAAEVVCGLGRRRVRPLTGRPLASRHAQLPARLGDRPRRPRALRLHR